MFWTKLLARTRCVAVVVLLLALRAGSVAHAQAELGTASIDPTQPGQTIASGYLGFSHEWADVPPFLTGPGAVLMGSPSTGANPIYRQLLLNLLAYGGGPFSVRIGGNSTDASTAPPSTDVLNSFAQLSSDLGVQFILGVNLGSGKPSLAAQQARAMAQGMPAGSLKAVEIGNEPDLYAGNHHRAANYSFGGFLKDFSTWRAAVLPVLPDGVKLAGPGGAAYSMEPNLPSLLDQERGNLSMVTFHFYAGTACNRSNPPNYLLAPPAATNGPQGAAPAVALAHRRSLSFRMDEINSISCGGQAGVSDTFASALWAVDTLFEYANLGVDGVNIHTGNLGNYGLFGFNIANQGGQATYSLQAVRPEYYGLLLFQQAAPAGARLLPVNLSTSANLKVWATQDALGTVRVTTINKDESAQGSIAIQLPGYSDGTLIRLQASSFDAQTGVTLGGQTFDGSQDGTIQGDAASETVSADTGAYTFDVPPVSAATLTVSPAGS